jgi:hypothetical protein
MLASIASLATCKVLGSGLRTALLPLALLGCGDPVRDRAVEALGPETPGVRVGPSHRPGQPCLLCHSEAGDAPPFSVAGTVYIDAPSLTPIDDVGVILIDSFGRKFSATTNCAGNFYVRPKAYTLQGPVWVSLERDEVLREMDTPVFRDGSCAGCHGDPLGPTSAGHVFLIDDPTVEKAPISRCP